MKNNSELLALPAIRLLEKFGAGNHKPGSGSAAALLSLVACKLLQTVVQLTNGRDKYADVKDQLSLVNQDMLSQIEPSLLKSFQEDSILFDHVIRTRRLRDAETDKDKKRSLREQHLRELEAATETPIQIARDSIAIAKNGLLIFDLGFQSARGDSGVAISAALSGASGALAIVFLNLTQFRGSDWAIRTRKKADAINVEVQELQRQMVKRLLGLRSEVISKESSEEQNSRLEEKTIEPLDIQERLSYTSQMGNDWQDIATAPKDGRHILISDGEFVFSAFWGDGPKDEGFYDNSDGIIHYEEPIFWRPIPFLPRI